MKEVAFLGLRCQAYGELVVKTIGYLMWDDIPTLVMDGVLSTNTLHDYIIHTNMSQATALSPSHIVSLASQVIDVVEFMHSNKIILCNLSCKNIFYLYLVSISC